MQELVGDEDFKNHGHRVRAVVRTIKRAIRQGPGRQEVSKGCFGCIVSQFAQKIPVEDQEICGIHGVCEVGEALDPSDSSCVEEVCDAVPACCEDQWSATCVGQVGQLCDEVCEPGATTTTVPPVTTTTIGGGRRRCRR